jgi:hypothetical protein
MLDYLISTGGLRAHFSGAFYAQARSAMAGLFYCGDHRSIPAALYPR